MEKGYVYLVGAGPGDIGLITLKGKEAIQKADVILYDRLANPKLLQFASSSCELIYCGKLPDRHTLRQENINQLLVDKALEGKMVVRLKGGDPGVFGRVGEEAEALVDNQVPFEIIPGISSGIAAPLYAGIPVTHREYGESFAVVTAHDKSEDGHPKLNWKALASGVDTIAFYMGIANLPFICDNLIENGKSRNTPVILIQWGTFGRQKTLEGTLETISLKAKEENFSNPAITLVGEIINLRKKINWFERKPLFGQEILVTKTTNEESDMAKELSHLGADVYEYPRWRKIAAPPQTKIIEHLGHYENILFTTSESVLDFFNIIVENNVDIRSIRAKFFGKTESSILKLREKGIIACTIAIKSIKKSNLLVVGDNLANNPYEEADFLLTAIKEMDDAFIPIFDLMMQEVKVDTILLEHQVEKEFLNKYGMNAKIINVNEEEYQKDTHEYLEIIKGKFGE